MTDYRFGPHIMERYVERILRMNPNTAYIEQMRETIEDGLIELIEDSFFLLEMETITERGPQMRQYYYNKEHALIIVMAQEGKAFVTLFEPDIPQIPPELKTKEIVESMAMTIRSKWFALEEIEKQVHKKTEGQSKRMKEIVDEIARLNEELEEVNREVNGHWKDYHAAKDKVIKLANFITDRGSMYEKKVTAH